MDDKNHKERILECAKGLFHKYGIRSISMDDIAHHLGISKKTIYQHFSDKDDIITLAMHQATAEKKDMLLGLRKQATDAIDMMIKIHQYILRNFDDTTASLVFELQKYHGDAWKIIQDFKYGFLAEFIKEDLQLGIDQGFFRNDINAEIVAKIRLEEVTMASNDRIFPKERFNHHEVSDSILEHFIQGIATERGKKLYKKHKAVLVHNEVNKINEE
jgi:TetR/AcrR family transcriptional regulator, cholesterol catabolism regulator